MFSAYILSMSAADVMCVVQLILEKQDQQKSRKVSKENELKWHPPPNKGKCVIKFY